MEVQYIQQLTAHNAVCLEKLQFLKQS